MQSNKIVNITFFAHGTTTDNEKELASGWADAELSELGKKQCMQLKELIKNKKFDFVFSSDLKRAVDTARLTFGNVRTIEDKRLRECDYGDFTRLHSDKVDSVILNYINKPFPNGESYRDVERRIRSLLNDLFEKYSGKNVAIIGHRATQLALDVLLKSRTWQQAIKEDWRSKQPKEWKPGWAYRLGRVLSPTTRAKSSGP
ncbi:MAG: histidine phosphatase family protein [Candidatus Aenigmarchaeota archaeon]|nr:histidine phosphatase family protein [Candidatus Aenigmarchaeota archaeon]